MTAARQLSADCSQCFGLCCVVPAFAASSDFAIDKPAGTPCPNLAADFGCSVHERLPELGFRGCTVYDCFGAGQRVSQETFGGVDWRSGAAPPMFDVFPVMRDLHELLWYVSESVRLLPDGPLRAALRAEADRLDALGGGSPAEVAELDVDALRGEVNPLLQQASSQLRGSGGPDLRGADLLGVDLRRRDLRGANLRGAMLVAADLRGVDLAGADVTGADMRDADLRGADLSGTLYLLQSQLDAARGDATTHLPPHWPAE
ncbi:pentapeptide repeat-containing protein [Luteipulveratus sp. YIM 133132]|uniref:pentapeptide repeat-containing protein n=1 Tax=Luteipulveratus flavus TaxID=3031728 RepID=UPI0023AF9861|nr:pentapeptide repeat-containing protein [Luteipulveratus sp. YIM 133132]MDE9364626.1 pentapeptide repeat-containing protein [Luteipulveratus sp. YIM 133132]